jgi:S-adenosylmethionine hydrolase
MSDFGLADGYVAQWKGAVLSQCPEVRIVDVTHSIPQHDIACGAWIWRTIADSFPEGTIHVGVVDPGVGGERRILLVPRDGSWWIAPDNGLLSMIVTSERPDPCFHLVPEKITGERISATFHGRDLMAPAAARIAAGDVADSIAEPADRIVRLPRLPRQKTPRPGDSLYVLHVDRFGNVILDLPRRHLEATAGRTAAIVHCGSIQLEQIHRSYEEGPPGTPFLIVNSADFLEIALRSDSAAERLQLRTGDRVRWGSAPS